MCKFNCDQMVTYITSVLETKGVSANNSFKMSVKCVSVSATKIPNSAFFHNVVYCGPCDSRNKQRPSTCTVLSFVVSKSHGVCSLSDV